MSFRRRKSRIGPSFQAVIPVILSSQQRQELQSLYDYEQSLSEHCLTLSSLSGPIYRQQMTSNQTSSSSDNITSTPSTSSTTNSNKAPFTINDTNIDHIIDPICFEISQSHPPQHFNYTNYVQQYQIYPHQSLQSKIEHFKSSSNRKRKHLDDIKTDSNHFTLPPPPKKQKIQHIPHPNIPPIPNIPNPFLTNTHHHILPSFPLQLKKDTLLTPSPPHPIPNIPHIPALPAHIMKPNTNNSSSPTSPLSFRTPQSLHSVISNTQSPIHRIPLVIPNTPPNTTSTCIDINNENNETPDTTKKRKNKKKSKKKKRRKMEKHCEDENSKDNKRESESDAGQRCSHVSQCSNPRERNIEEEEEHGTPPPPIPLNTRHAALDTTSIEPPPPTFLPLQPPTRTALTHGYPHISYTHYNPQFYYMHTTYNYAVAKPTKTINPALIKKQRIDNKSCEVIDLCGDENAVTSITNYQYAPYTHRSAPMQLPQFPLIPRQAHMVHIKRNTNQLVTPPVIAPTNEEYEDDKVKKYSKKKKKKTKTKKETKNNRKRDRNVVNNKIQIKRKHVGLFESLLTPKPASNSQSNSTIINRVLQQPSYSSAQYQKLETMNRKGKTKGKKNHNCKGKKSNKNSYKMVPLPIQPYMAMTHYNPHNAMNTLPFPLPPQMIPIQHAPIPIMMQQQAHLAPMIVPNADMTMPSIGTMPMPIMTPFMLAPPWPPMDPEHDEKDLDALLKELKSDLKVDPDTPYSLAPFRLNMNMNMNIRENDDYKTEEESDDNDADSDFSLTQIYRKKKHKRKHKKKHKRKHKKKKKDQKKKKSSSKTDNENKSEYEAMQESQLESDSNDISGYANAQHPNNLGVNTNLFSNFNVSPNHASFGMQYNIHRSASPPFGLSGDDLYGSMPFGLYGNDSPLMPVDIDRHSPPPSYS